MSALTTGDRESSLLPTLSASSYGSNQGGAAGREGPDRPSLDTMARRGLLPTLTGADNQLSPCMQKQAAHRRLATLTASAATRGAGWPDRPGRPVQEQLGGVLNPDWCEVFMGFPPGWTRLESQLSGTNDDPTTRGDDER
jgi:hypothetical protein